MARPYAQGTPCQPSTIPFSTPFRSPDPSLDSGSNGSPTGAVGTERRRSEYIVAVATPKRKQGGQEEMIFDDGASAKPRANDRINAIRAEVSKWRSSPEPAWGVTYETARLLKHWRDRLDRERPLFFCQVEAAETIIC